MVGIGDASGTVLISLELILDRRDGRIGDDTSTVTLFWAIAGAAKDGVIRGS